MTMLRNMKMRAKLLLGFGLLLAIIVIIAGYSIFDVITLESDASYLRDFPSRRYNYLNYASNELTNLQRIASVMPFYSDNHDSLNQMLADGLQAGNDFIGHIEAYASNLAADDRINPTVRNNQIAIIATIEAYMALYMDEVIRAMHHAVLTADTEGQYQAFQRAGALITPIMADFGEMMNAIRITVDSIYSYISNASTQAIWVMSVLGTVGIIIGIGVAIFISGTITKSIKEVGQIVNNVSNGNFNINFKSELSKDEIGVMTEDVYSLINVVRSMVDDVSLFSHEFNVKGDIEYRIDANKYKGGYNEMVVSLNDFSDAIVSDILAILGVLGNVNKGDFKAELNRLPGKRAVLNKAVDELMTNLSAVRKEIDGIINAAAILGDLDYRINESNYEGGWREIMLGLNDIAIAVDAPVVEIRDVMELLAEGKFSGTSVTGNYKGDFLAISGAVNKMISTLNDYISEIANVLNTISNGDLTHVIKREYVGDFELLKKPINNISSTLHRTMSEISMSSDQVLTGASQIAQSASDLSSGAQEQAGAVQELNATIDLINEQTGQNAESASTANELSNKSAANAQDGNEAMKQMLEAMTQIKESSNAISAIVKTIQDIAFQTNLLALNASVEAARAGEHGRGFSVVADEVRTLAGRSQAAASETTNLIQDSISRVESGSSIAGATAESLNAIVESAAEVLSIISSISTASKEQAEAIANVSIGLAQISQVTQNNSAVSEETAAASQELNSQSEMLKHLVSYFKL